MKNFRLKFFPISKVHLMILILFAAAFCTGSLLGKTTGQLLPDFGSVSASSENTSWGLSFQEKGKRPIGNASIEELKKYNAYYAADTEEKIIYLTFDCGYENGNMPKILEALKKHQVSAAFFVVGNFISDHPDLLRKMIQAGHTIGNHTMTHPDMSSISSTQGFQKELQDVEELYQSATGSSMPKYYRPPRGIYSPVNLSMAKELGYKTFFWKFCLCRLVSGQTANKRRGL